MQHPLRKPVTKAPSAEAQAAGEIKERLNQYSSRWDVQAVTKGTTDAAAPLQAAKGFAALVAQLQQHRGVCKRAEVRQQFAKQLSAALLGPLLSSSIRDAVSLTLQALLDYARLLPGLLPVQLAGQLLQLLESGTSYGISAAKLLTEQLTHWRIIQVWPDWLSHQTTQQIHQQLQQQLHVLGSAAAPTPAGFNYSTATAAGCSYSSSNASPPSSSSKALELFASYLSLLARMVHLAEVQMVSQVAGSAAVARSWLQLLVTACQQQHSGAMNPVLYSQVIDSSCQLLAAMSKTGAVGAVLQQDESLKLRLLEVLHNVLQRPCYVNEFDESSVQCWIHAAQAAAMPIMWQPLQAEDNPAANTAAAVAAGISAAAASLSQTQMLATVAVSAAATYRAADDRTSCASRWTVQLARSALLLQTAAVKPESVPYGSKQPAVGKFLPPILASDHYRVMLHALAVASEREALAVSTAADRLLPLARQAEEQAPGLSSGLRVDVVAAPATVATAHQMPLAWQVLRMICAQSAVATAAAVEKNSTGGSSSKRITAAVQMDELVCLLQAYAQADGSTRKPLHKLQMMLCVSAALLQQQQQQQQRWKMSQKIRSPSCDKGLTQHVSSSSNVSNGSSSSSSRCSSDGEDNSGLSTAQRTVPAGTTLNPVTKVYSVAANGSNTLKHALRNCARGWSASASKGPEIGDPSSSSSSSSSCRDAGDISSSQKLGHQLMSCSHLSLSVALAVTEAAAAADGGSGLELAAAEMGVVLAACDAAAAALRVLLPALFATFGNRICSSKLQQQTPCQASGTRPDCTVSAAATVDSKHEQQRRQKVCMLDRCSSPCALEGVPECSLACLQALVLLARAVKPLLPGVVACCSSSSTTNVDVSGAAAAKAAVAAMQDLQRGLDVHLQQLLSHTVAGWLPTNEQQQQQQQIGKGQRDAGLHHVLSVELLLQQQLQQEVRCWAAAALAECYGQLGSSSSSSSEGAALAAAREPGAEFTDAVLLLPANEQQQLDLPVHAAVVAAGCPILGQQLAAAAAKPGGQVRLSASVNAAASKRALDFIYTGAAVVPAAWLPAHLAAATAAIAQYSSSSSRWQQPDQLLNAQNSSSSSSSLDQLQALQQQGQEELQVLGKLSKKLQLPLLTALCNQGLPGPGQRLQQMHPQLHSLLPQQVLLADATATCAVGQGVVTALRSDHGHDHYTMQQIDADFGMSPMQQENQRPAQCADGSTTYGISSSSSSSLALQQQQVHAAVMPQAASDEAAGSSSSKSCGRHQGSRAYLEAVASFSTAALQTVWYPAVPHHHCCHQQQQQQQMQVQEQGSNSNRGSVQSSQFADVMLAAPAWIQPACQVHRQQQQQAVAAGLLPAHRVLLSGRCQYFEALLSQRWGPGAELSAKCYESDGHLQEQQQQQCQLTAAAGVSTDPKQQQQQQQRLLKVVVVPEADIHVAAALQHWLYTGELSVQLPSDVEFLDCLTQLRHQQQQQGQQEQQQQQDQQQEGQQAGHSIQQLDCYNSGSCTQHMTSNDSPFVDASSDGRSRSDSLGCKILAAGCCHTCHAARTLLRLWRCADLLLLLDLQQQCAEELQVLVWQKLDSNCCLQLLSDCVKLGMAAAADDVIRCLAHKSDKDTATACPEWSTLPTALQNVLIGHFTEHKRESGQSLHNDLERAPDSNLGACAESSSVSWVKMRDSAELGPMQLPGSKSMELGMHRRVEIPWECADRFVGALGTLGSLLQRL